MNTILLEPRKAINKAFLKIKPSRNFIELFKINLIQVLDRINEKESEEFHKNLIIEFLKKTYYDPNHFLNTKGRNDLVIHNGSEPTSAVAVIIEAKSPSNKSEMISTANPNKKAFQELVYYYMRERITHKNTELKNLVVTNIYEWFIFDAQMFNKLFAENKNFVKQFIDFESKRASGSSTDYFYKEIAEPFINSLPATIEYTHFDIRNYEKPLRNSDKDDDRKLIALFKLLSPEHLLKLSFANDSNSLDKNFYNELLHIIGLTETKEAGKKIIERNKPAQRNPASLIENAITQLDSMDKLSRINAKQYGNSEEEQLFTIALELVITWVNRILFLKLLEAQLISYHAGDKKYAFLNNDKIKDYDNLNSLFFQILAKKYDNRANDIQKMFESVPYLNSSLFEMTDTEHNMFPISQLEDNKKLPLLPSTVVKDNNGKKITGEMNALNYFFAFLDAYDFSSEGSEDIQEDNKALINASVLGLIFEKINGYKDGSFFTPGFITMYMCRESIQKAVVQKFNFLKQWDCKNYNDLHNKITDITEANQIVNSIKICDPAVGSGHFLVSALNEIISLKSKIGILCDKDGRLLKGYNIIIENDELMIFDDHDGTFFKYNPLSKESQRIQETLFNEKKTIIESCLFGVDINQNSVKICRLRLWIELLKNAYYKRYSTGVLSNELETLPNIDINIKAGNSLISRFSLQADLKKALKLNKSSIEVYKSAIDTYHNAESKEQKREMEMLIADIKGNFRKEISANSKEVKELAKISSEFYNKYVTDKLFEEKLTKAQIKNKQELSKIIEKKTAAIEEIKSGQMYQQAFEWRFEFPEALDGDGNYQGFDVIIGNPPYIQLQKMGQSSIDLSKMEYKTFTKTGDIYSLFYELGISLLRPNGYLAFITSNKWMRAAYGESLRQFFTDQSNPEILIDFGGVQVFETATVDTNILITQKAKYDSVTNACVLDKDFSINNTSDYLSQRFTNSVFRSDSWVVLSSIEREIKQKIESIGIPLKDWDVNIYRGILTGYNEAFIISQETRDRLVAASSKNDEIIRPILRGRDIKKYKAEWAGLYIITTFPCLKIDIDDYPAVREHLLNFGYDRLKQTGDPGARKKAPNKWFETQDSINYWEDFNKPKLVYPDIMRMPGQVSLLSEYPYFYYDRENYYAEATNFIMTGENIDLIYSFLTSELGFFAFSKFYTGPQFDSTGFRYKKAYLDETFIPTPNEDQAKALRNVINNITQGANIHEEINNIWYDIVSLEYSEIEYVNSYKRKLLAHAV